MKLSKSACEKWMACPASYDYYYNKGIRPIKIGSALMFGSGIDAALNELLMPTTGINHVDVPMEAYRGTVAGYKLGKVLPGKYDFDSDLLNETHHTQLLVKLEDVGYKGDDVIGLYSTLFSRHQAGEELSENQYKAIDLIIRAVFEVKAKLMLQAYEEKVLPFIKKVHSVQERAGPGVLDAVVDWEDIGTVILDNKTASRSYPENAVEYSVQLAMYAAEKKIYKVAYVVLGKQLKKNRIKTCSVCENDGTGKRHKTCDALVDTKRCDGEWNETILPEVEIQILHGEVTPEMVNVADELQESVGRAVEAKIFPCNVAQCNSQFGKQCEYKNLKWKNDMTGLEVRPRGKK